MLGLLDDTETRATPFIITPVVGLVTGPVDFVPDGREIERVLEVPLRVLRDPAIFHTEMREWNGEAHLVHFYRVSAEDVIWGATARILNQFLGLLEAGEGATVGLCAGCAHGQRVLSARGSVFWLCRRAAKDAAFVRYPRLPVLRCPGYEQEAREP